MPSTTSLVNRLKADYPQFAFKKASDFSWSHTDNAIYYTSSKNEAFLFHELAHGLLNHTDYGHDIELVVMEREAWDKAKELATRYEVAIDDDFIQSTLDTYRDWLHMRSSCPKCDANGLQTGKNTYKCLECNNVWRVNEARLSALRRYSSKK